MEGPEQLVLSRLLLDTAYKVCVLGGGGGGQNCLGPDVLQLCVVNRAALEMTVKTTARVHLEKLLTYSTFSTDVDNLENATEKLHTLV